MSQSLTKEDKDIMEEVGNRTRSHYYEQNIMTAERLDETNLHLKIEFLNKYSGKVRDVYEHKDRILLVSTDRQSAFDRHLASIPFKGQVLTQTSAWWFKKTENIVPNHFISIPDPNAILAQKCTIFPVEFVVRGYITGSTSTSLWTNYAQGKRLYCGHALPEELKQHQKLQQNLVTPTTKDAVHDELISGEEIIKRGLMTESQWLQCERYALEIFQFGQEEASKRGLILVDTKYEFGMDKYGKIVLVDEIHTPDSSRYWIAKTYEERMAAGAAPESIDKEFLRLWFKERCDPYKDEVLPEAPLDLVNEVSRRYIMLYELITGEAFQFPEALAPGGIKIRIEDNIRNLFVSDSP